MRCVGFVTRKVNGFVTARESTSLVNGARVAQVVMRPIDRRVS